MGIIFGASSLNAIIASFICYPIDTFKRHIQVTGSLGYKSEYNGGLLTNFRQFLGEGATGMYRGFVPNLYKTILFPLVLFTFRAE